MLGLRVSSFKGSARIPFALVGWVPQCGCVSVRHRVQLGRCLRMIGSWQNERRRCVTGEAIPIHQQMIHHHLGVVRLVDKFLCEKGHHFVERDDAWQLLCNLLIRNLQCETARKLGAGCRRPLDVGVSDSSCLYVCFCYLSQSFYLSPWETKKGGGC